MILVMILDSSIPTYDVMRRALQLSKKTVCPHCKRNRPLEYVPPQTCYPDDKGDNLCNDCAVATVEFWNEQWKEYQRSQGYG
jgi:hypothetical protein